MTQPKLKTTDLNKNADEGATITALELADLRKASQEVADLRKAAEESATALADLTKANEDANAKLKTIELEKAAAAKTSMTDLVKGFTFIGEEDVEATVESLLKSKDSVILTTLHKAQVAIDNFATTEHGTDATVDVEKSAAEQANEDFDTVAADVWKSRNHNKGAK